MKNSDGTVLNNLLSQTVTCVVCDAKNGNCKHNRKDASQSVSRTRKFVGAVKVIPRNERKPVREISLNKSLVVGTDDETGEPIRRTVRQNAKDYRKQMRSVYR